MTCIECRAALLVADAAEWRAGAATVLADHVAGCADCGMVARRLETGFEALRGAVIVRTRQRAARRQRMWMMAPVALAAGIIAAVAMPRHDARTGAVTPRAAVQPQPDAGLPVTPEPAVRTWGAVGASSNAPDLGTEYGAVGRAPAIASDSTADSPDPALALIDDVAPTDSAPTTVSVRSAGNRRFAVIGLQDHKTTLIWVY